MTLTRKKADKPDTMHLIKVFLILLPAIACILSIKAAYDLGNYFDTFPAWFVPGFVSGIIILIITCLYFVRQMWRVHDRPDFLATKPYSYLWILMIFSFICTTSVHGFYPFQLDISSVLPGLNSVLRFNFLIAAAGVLTSTLLAGLYVFTSWKLPALIGLIGMGYLLLIPNDNCANQFNFWWIAKIGASPLMYVPNVYAAFFVVCGLFGIHPKVAVFLLLGICTASLLLGLGHQFRIIW
jgi:hypothetical protein